LVSFWIAPDNDTSIPTAQEAGKVPETVWTLWRREESLILSGI
jgi:hypothetical protein